MIKSLKFRWEGGVVHWDPDTIAEDVCLAQVTLLPPWVVARRGEGVAKRRGGEIPRCIFILRPPWGC